MTDEKKQEENEKKQKENKGTTPPPDPQAFLTPKQAAAFLAISIGTIYRYCHDDADPKIPHKRGLNGLIRIRRQDLERWFDESKNRPRKPRSKKPPKPSSESR